MTREAVVQLVEGAAEELLPILGNAIQGLLAGKPPEQVLTHAERALLADLADKRLDAALAHKPPFPGTGITG